MLPDLLAPLAPPLCWTCQAPAARGSALCRECRGSLRFLPTRVGPAWAAVAYEGPARDLVKALKFNGATRIADEIAAIIAANAPPSLLGWSPPPASASAPPPAPPPLPSPTLAPPGAPAPLPSLTLAPPGASAPALVPVPLHPARERARGFNQAALVARALAARTGLAVVDCLRRRGPATRQVGRDRAARLRGPADEIVAACTRGATVPQRALIVDDVVTTGATVAACATALRAVGVTEIDAVAFARTTGR